jgi:hypothetical protein
VAKKKVAVEKGVAQIEVQYPTSAVETKMTAALHLKREALTREDPIKMPRSNDWIIARVALLGGIAVRVAGCLLLCLITAACAGPERGPAKSGGGEYGRPRRDQWQQLSPVTKPNQ